ncbi:hypothetical protein J3R83DRAFT_10120 [Lanmaoa asiatica]|nr:hypothetical protein J3R83DRAFT_10120 [Lanmaoa asiatica]
MEIGMQQAAPAPTNNTRTCHLCGKPGHIKPNCPSNPNRHSFRLPQQRQQFVWDYNLGQYIVAPQQNVYQQAQAAQHYPRHPLPTPPALAAAVPNADHRSYVTEEAKAYYRDKFEVEAKHCAAKALGSVQNRQITKT